MRGLDSRAVVVLSVVGLLLGFAFEARAQLPDEGPSSTGNDQAQSSTSGDTQAVPKLSGAAVPIAGAIEPERYVLGPGDVLRLEFSGRAFGSQEMVVDGEGRIRVPSMGTMLVAGKTLAEFRRSLLEELKRYFPRATVDLRLVQPRRFKVFVLGEVKVPGLTVVTGSARVTEALEAAGGLQAGAGSRTVQVLRRDNSVRSADLERFNWTGDWDSNPYLEDGDRIVVPTKTQRIGVFGALARPGWIEYRQDDSLSTVIRLVGGVLPRAVLDRVLVVRFRNATSIESLFVDLRRVMDGSESDVSLRPDDRVYVPSDGLWHAAWQVSIEGEVDRPGVYPIREGTDRVSDLVRWAGSFTPSAARKNVQLIRRPLHEKEDFEFDRLSKLSRSEMTQSEYNAFRSKLSLRQSIYLVDFSSGTPQPPGADILLRDGDEIQVLREELAVRVDGSVRTPGLIAFTAGQTFQDYLRMAGGPTARANVGQTQLTRFGTNETKPAVNAARIEPGDFIWVPERKDTSVWDTVKDVLAVAGQAATIVLLFDTLRH